MGDSQMLAIDTPSARTPAVAYWISLVLVPVIFLLTMSFIDRAPPIDPSLLRSTLRALVSDSQQPPDFSAVAPDDFAGHIDFVPVDARNIASAWYQVEIPLQDTPSGLWAVYFPTTYATFAVYVNGALAGASSPMVPPYAYFRTPVYLEFSSALLRPGTNTIEVHTVSVRYGSFMEPFYAGPAHSIRPAYAIANFLQVTLVRAAVVALVLIFLLSLGLFWVRPAETGYAWFAAATLCWAAYNAMLLEPRMLIPPPGLWFSLPPIALGWFTICSAAFINRLPGCGGPQRRIEKGFLAFGVIGALAIIAHRLVSHEASWIQSYVWLPGVMLINAYIAWRLLLAVRRNPTFEVRLWLLAAVLTLVIGVWDYLSDEGIVPIGSVHYLSYTVSLVLVVFGLTLLSRVTRALTEAEMLNRELEDRVAAKGRELEHNYALLQSLERERAISAERERMTTDMHDGIGGQLVHALAVIESNATFAPIEADPAWRAGRSAPDHRLERSRRGQPARGAVELPRAQRAPRAARRAAVPMAGHRSATADRLRSAQDPAGAAHPPGISDQRAQACRRQRSHGADQCRQRCRRQGDHPRGRDRQRSRLHAGHVGRTRAGQHAPPRPRARRLDRVFLVRYGQPRAPDPAARSLIRRREPLARTSGRENQSLFWSAAGAAAPLIKEAPETRLARRPRRSTS